MTGIGSSHGNVTMQWVLDDSLNNGAIDAEKMEGQNAFYNNLLAFGIGAPTGIDLAGEVNNAAAPASSWNDLRYAEASFGQGLVTTPVEMLAAVNAVANGGVWVQPHVVDAVVNPNTGKTTPFVPVTRRVISAAAANTLAHMMVGVVNDPGRRGQAGQDPRIQHGDRRQDRHGPGRAPQRGRLRPQRGGVLRRLHARRPTRSSP